MPCGLSSIDLLAVIILGTGMRNFGLAMGFRRLSAGSPLVAGS